MLDRAGRDYDVLVVPYVSRFGRDLRTAVNARHELHHRCAAILFCDERMVSSDEEGWEQWAREAVQAEAYSRRLGKRIREGYAAKYRRHADQAGNAPRGFRRGAERPHLLEVDPATIGAVVAAFERYATGTATLSSLETETGIRADGLRAMLSNTIYNGWVRRRRGSSEEELSPAPWRANPPVPDALWNRVQEVRHDHWTGGGGAQPRSYLLGKLIWCRCGARVRADSNTPAPGYTYRRYRHPRPCSDWRQGSYTAAVYEAPIEAQINTLRLDAAHLVSLRALAGRRAPSAAPMLRRQIERELEERARDHATRRLSTPAYLTEHERLTRQLDELAAVQPAAVVASPDEIVRALTDLREAWRDGDEEDRRAVVQAIYQRVTVADDEIVEAELTAHAWRHGLGLVLRELVSLARPAGFEPAT
jgi:DNA invertase Pin-like site-specific DNA recombinase